jgi:hypothetical protein
MTAPSQERLDWEPLFALHLDVAFGRAQKLGATPLGGRVIYPIDGGHFAGPRLKGIVLPGGVDWALRRTDNATAIDVRLGLRTEDGADIAMAYTGLISMSDAAAGQRGRGEAVDYAETYVRTTPRFETADVRYEWLNRIIAVANGSLDPKSPTYWVFAIR